MFELDKYEKGIEKSFDNDEWPPVKDSDKLKSFYSKYARNTFKKDKRINIRISEKDLLSLKAKSLEEGIPYQTLISSILHKYLNGRFVEQS